MMVVKIVFLLYYGTPQWLSPVCLITVLNIGNESNEFIFSFSPGVHPDSINTIEQESTSYFKYLCYKRYQMSFFLGLGRKVLKTRMTRKIRCTMYIVRNPKPGSNAKPDFRR